MAEKEFIAENTRYVVRPESFASLEDALAAIDRLNAGAPATEPLLPSMYPDPAEEYRAPRLHSRPAQQRQTAQPQARSTERTKAAQPERGRFTKKRLFLGLGAVALAGGLVAVGSVTHFSPQQVFASGTSVDSGTTVKGVNTLGVDNLSSKEWDKPVVVVTMTAETSLVPNIDSGKITPQYMNETYEKNLTAKADKDKFQKFITDDGYNHARVESLPLAGVMKIDGTAIKEKNNVIESIDRSNIKIIFEDPRMLSTDQTAILKPTFQVNSAKPVLTESKKQYYSFPNAKNLFIGPRTTTASTSNTVYNNNLKIMTTAMGTTDQQQNILYRTEEGAIDDWVNGDKHVDYPSDNDKSARDVFDAALFKRLGIDPSHPPTMTGSYDVEVSVPRSSNTKQPYTDTPLIGLAPQPVNLDQLTVTYGSSKVSKAKPTSQASSKG